jgi:hypothetical protein
LPGWLAEQEEGGDGGGLDEEAQADVAARGFEAGFKD